MLVFLSLPALCWVPGCGAIPPAFGFIIRGQVPCPVVNKRFKKPAAGGEAPHLGADWSAGRGKGLS